MLLSHYGVRQDIINLESYAKSLGVLTRGGVSPKSICTILKSFGLNAEYEIAEWGSITQESGIKILFINGVHYALVLKQKNQGKAVIYDPIFGIIDIDAVNFKNSQQFLIIKTSQKNYSSTLNNPLGSQKENHILLYSLLFLYSKFWTYI